MRTTGDGISRLYCVAPDGSSLRVLGRESAGWQYPSWSPDGSRLVVVGHDDSDDGMLLGELHVVDPDGGAATRITWDAAPKLRPSWSPDGSEITFERAVGSEGYHLFAVRPDGSGLRQITGPPSAGPVPPRSLAPGSVKGFATYGPIRGRPPASTEEMPTWSPDGARIAFTRVSHGAGHGEGARPAHHLFTVRADGTDERQVTQGPVHDLDPAWSPDGSRLVFARHTDEELLPQSGGGATSAVRLWLVRPVGSDLEPLTPDPANYMAPCWAPDGTGVVCSRSLDGPTHIWRIDPTQGTGQAVTDPGTDGDYDPAWRPIP